MPAKKPKAEKPVVVKIKQDFQMLLVLKRGGKPLTSKEADTWLYNTLQTYEDHGHGEISWDGLPSSFTFDGAVVEVRHGDKGEGKLFLSWDDANFALGDLFLPDGV